MLDRTQDGTVQTAQTGAGRTAAARGRPVRGGRRVAALVAVPLTAAVLAACAGPAAENRTAAATAPAAAETAPGAEAGAAAQDMTAPQASAQAVPEQGAAGRARTPTASQRAAAARKARAVAARRAQALAARKRGVTVEAERRAAAARAKAARAEAARDKAARDRAARDKAATPGAPAPRPRPTTPAKAPAAAGMTAVEALVLRIVNTERASAGCGPLTGNRTLTGVARAHSKDMAVQGYFSHTGKDGSSPFDRMKRAGYRGRMMGENIAAGQSSAQAVMKAWMGSPGHRANILNCGYKEIGIGHHKGGSMRQYWTQAFGTR